MAPGGEEWDTAVAELVERYGITTAAGVSYGETRFRMPGGTVAVQTRRVSPNYGGLHRIEPIDGRWLRAGDRENLSPAIVVNEAFMTALGVPDLSSRPTVVIAGADPVRATIVGVVREGYGGGTHRLPHRSVVRALGRRGCRGPGERHVRRPEHPRALGAGRPGRAGDGQG